MYLQIKNINKQKSNFGNDLLISKVGLYDDNGKWIKWCKLNDTLIEVLLTNKIKYGNK